MGQTTDERIDALEARIKQLEENVKRVEGEISKLRAAAQTQSPFRQ